jgi:Transglutaminase-like superfamily
VNRLVLNIGPVRNPVHWTGPNSFVRPNPRCGAKLWHGLFLVLAAWLTFSSQAAFGLSLEELKADRNLTPESLMKYVASFRFEPGRAVRSPDEFLSQQCGDCDDFATLAADVLRERGYQTRLVAVFMPGEVHVVCYVAEVSSYLDFNRRKERSPLVKCDGALSAIGASVAQSFHSEWISTSEYTFQKGVTNFVLTAFH